MSGKKGGTVKWSVPLATANEVDCGIARGYEGSIPFLHFFTPQGVDAHLLRFPVSVTSLLFSAAGKPSGLRKVGVVVAVWGGLV